MYNPHTGIQPKGTIRTNLAQISLTGPCHTGSASQPFLPRILMMAPRDMLWEEWVFFDVNLKG